MPPIWSGRRRILLAELACLGVLQAVIAVIMSLTVTRILDGASNLGLLLVFTTIGIGGARWIERVVAEDLGQDYVHEQRRRLVASALVPGNVSSLGVTVTRASNDLTSVRNWLASGIVPLVTGIPLIGVVLVALFAQDWRTGLAVIAPLLVCVSVLPVLARWTLARARELRKRRGRMAARIADSVMAGEAVRAAGGIHRELSAVDRDSTKVVDGAVQRAWATGLTRAVMLMGTSLSTVFVVLAGHLEAADVAGTMMLLGVLATPVSDLGRVVEYRQNFRAAKRILVPLFERAASFEEEESRKPGLTKTQETGVQIGQLHAELGERIHLTASDPYTVRSTIAELIDTGDLTINGHHLAELPLRDRRSLMGVASAHHHVERGSVSRIAGYRVPDATEFEIHQALTQVGLQDTINADPLGLKRQLKNGGKPWTSSDIARLKLARATLRQPPLLIVEDIPHIPADYPGVIIASGGVPAGEWRTWDLDSISV